MPTLDDAPTLSANTALAGDDLIQIYDVSAGEPRVMTIDQFLKVLGPILPTSSGETGEIYAATGVLTVS